MRLLVVEDEKKLCDMIAKSLHQAGYEVDTCNDGEEALDMIYAEMYDLIVLDLNLPGMDGMDILRELRGGGGETKVLILSARSQIADKVDGLDAGANDYMEKPFHLQELEARVRSLTRRKCVQKNVRHPHNTVISTVVRIVSLHWSDIFLMLFHLLSYTPHQSYSRWDHNQVLLSVSFSEKTYALGSNR